MVASAPGGFLSREISVPAAVGKPDAELAETLRRELQSARSELRLSPEERPALIVCGAHPELSSPAVSQVVSEELHFTAAPVESLFPVARISAEGFRMPTNAVALASALQAADRTQPLSVNLLPPEARTYESPLIYLPAYGLAGLIVILAIALGLRGTIQDWRYEQHIAQQIEALQPQLEAVERAQQRTRSTYQRLALLSGLRDTASLPIEAMEELTRILPQDVWLQQMAVDGDTLAITGFATSASPLLALMASSRYLENPQFLSSISRTQDGKELFRIGARIRKPDLTAAAAGAGAGPATR